jgi:transcriptional regulator with XRE-family HTH domain
VPGWYAAGLRLAVAWPGLLAAGAPGAATTTLLPRFGELLKRYRLAAGLTQEALAERAGLSARAVSDLERGPARLPRMDSVNLLQEALALTALERANLQAAARPAAHDSDAIQAESLEIPRAPPREWRSRIAMAVPLSSFVGRERELDELAALLGHRHRLVTLTGPAGSGKTRLAVEAARRGADVFADGVWLVELGAVSDSALVGPAVAVVLGVVERAAEPLVDTLARSLASRRLLLVLDNCEHLVDACGDLCAHLLGACPGVQVLATSHEVLRLPGEHAWPVPPLGLPAEGRTWRPPLPASLCGSLSSARWHGALVSA